MGDYTKLPQTVKAPAYLYLSHIVMYNTGMKKWRFVIVLFAFLTGVSFGDTGEQEEVDFLLFLPNSSDQFTDVELAKSHLDATASYLRSKNLNSGQIHVYGYAAVAANDIEPVHLSMERAIFVINELQKRGLTSDLFAEPDAYGSVDLWGSNADEEDRSPNRRVRIVLEGTILTPAIVQVAEPEPEDPSIPSESSPTESPRAESSRTSLAVSFPWWIPLLALLLVAVIIFAALKRKKSAPSEREPIPQAPPAPAIKPQPIPAIPVVKREKIWILTEEEIRRYAYGLYEWRHGCNGDAVGDWHQAIHELTARYEAQGYRVMLYWEAQ